MVKASPSSVVLPSLLLFTVFAFAVLYLSPSLPTWTHRRARVDLQIFVMSKCPDARDCEAVIQPALEEMYQMVDFDVHFLGRLNDTEELGVWCRHGSGECKGDILEICAKKTYPFALQYMQFINCLSSAYNQIPSRALTTSCASLAGMEISLIDACTTSLGTALLQRDVVYSASLVNVTRYRCADGKADGKRKNRE